MGAGGSVGRRHRVTFKSFVKRCVLASLGYKDEGVEVPVGGRSSVGPLVLVRRKIKSKSSGSFTFVFYLSVGSLMEVPRCLDRLFTSVDCEGLR